MVARARQRRRAQRHQRPTTWRIRSRPAVEAVRLGLYALVRLGSYDGLAGAVLDADGRPRSRWWPIAYALQRVNDARAVPALLDLLNGEGQLTRAFAARGLGQSKDPRAAAPLLAIAENAGEPTRGAHPGGARRRR